MKKGFTLIELLVVVLIIGILASVALPQYQKTVAKSRYAAMKPLVQSIATAEELYFLANGTYTGNVEDLDLDIGGTAYSSTPSRREFPWGYCKIETNLSSPYAYCCNTQISGRISYMIKFDGKRYCVAYGGDSTALNHQICKQETNNATPGGANNWYKYP